MIDFILLGIVPGTNIQINFEGWLIGSCSLIVLSILALLIRHRAVLTAVTALALRRNIRCMQAHTAHQLIS